MRNKEIPALRGQSVNLLFTVIFIVFSINVNAQTKLNGKYCIDYGTKDVYTCITFLEDSTFEYNSGGDFGNNEYGKGIYIIDKDTLILKYNLTEPKLDVHTESLYWVNSLDSIQVKLRLKETNNGPMAGAHIEISTTKEIHISEMDGSATFKLKKIKELYFGKIRYVGFPEYHFVIDGTKNYVITTHFNKNPLGQPIKNEVKTFLLSDVQENSFRAKNDHGVLFYWYKIKTK